MSDLIEQLGGYRAHLDRAIEDRRGASPETPVDLALGATGVVEETMVASGAPATRWRLLAAAAAVIVMIGVAVALVDNGPARDATAPADSAATSVVPTSIAAPVDEPAEPRAYEVVQLFFDAINAGDGQSAVELLAPEAAVYGHPNTARWTAERPLADAAFRGDASLGATYEVPLGLSEATVLNYDFVGTIHFDLVVDSPIERMCFPNASAHVSGGLITSFTFGTNSICDDHVPKALGLALASGDVQAALELFSETGQIRFGADMELYSGLPAIERFLSSISAEPVSADRQPLTIDGHPLTWQPRWTGKDGVEMCIFEQDMQVVNGRVTMWTLGEPAAC